LWKPPIGEQCPKHGFPPLQLCPSTIAARTLPVSSGETSIFVHFQCTGNNQLPYFYIFLEHTIIWLYHVVARTHIFGKNSIPSPIFGSFFDQRHPHLMACTASAAAVAAVAAVAGLSGSASGASGLAMDSLDVVNQS